MEFFNSRLYLWYSVHKRDLPWRNTTDPYLIWLSEVILQQTRIDQGMQYFLRFADEFPTIKDLANASEDRVLKLWQGLGYYSRARNLHFTAKYISEHYKGIFPATYHEILSLKGVGEYTAAAIASISLNQEHAVVDGNVYRLISRYFGIEDPIDSTQGKKLFAEIARSLIRGADPGFHNQAMMEFGALQCVPRNPDCVTCPLKEKCIAFSQGNVDKLPFKKNSVKQRTRYFNYLVLISGHSLWLRKRINNDIWRNLYEFPIVESESGITIDEFVASIGFRDIVGSNQFVARGVTEWQTHILSHQRIVYRFIELQLIDDFALPADLFKVNKEDIYNFAVPKLLEEYLHQNRFFELFI